MERIELEREGTRLACLDSGGAGSPVLSLHGLAGHAGEWRSTARWLTAFDRVLALDQRGHGRSERHPVDVSRRAFVADAAYLIERLGLAPVVVVGQSIGANTAFLLAAEHPHLIERLIVIETSPTRLSSDAVANVAARLAAWPVPFASRADATRFFAARGMEPEAWVDGLQSRDGGLWPAFERSVMVDCMADLARREYWRQWRSIACPTLIVTGERGHVPRDEAQRMAGAIPHGHAVEITRAGHDVHLEAGDQLREAVQLFLSGAGRDLRG